MSQPNKTEQHVGSVYVVERGQYQEGGEVAGVAATLESAVARALAIPYCFEPWVEVDVTDGHLREWQSGCDYIRIRKWEIEA